MKKILLIIMSLSLVLCGCSDSISNLSDTTTTPSMQPSVIPATSNDIFTLTAEELVDQLQTSGMPLNKTLVHNDKNDAMLGKKDFYISKVDFEDREVTSINGDSLYGGSIETFRTEIDALNRKKYFDDDKSDPYKSLIYQYKNILIFTSYFFSEDKVKQYNDALTEILLNKNQSIIPTIIPTPDLPYDDYLNLQLSSTSWTSYFEQGYENIDYQLKKVDGAYYYYTVSANKPKIKIVDLYMINVNSMHLEFICRVKNEEMTVYYDGFTKEECQDIIDMERLDK